MARFPIYPPNLNALRGVFRGWVERLRARWPQAAWHTRPWPTESPAGALETLDAPATREPRWAVVLTAGVHGVEAHVGAAMLDLFLREFAPGLNPATTGLHLAPVLNPWGLAHGRRVNAANVDLNRNFLAPTVQGAFPRVANPAYQRLHAFLNPARPLHPKDWWTFWPRALLTLFRSGGVTALRTATLQGQSAYPRGIFFTGQTWQPETLAGRAWLQRLWRTYRQVLHLDVHTGYGPAGVLTIILPQGARHTPADIRAALQYPAVTQTAASDVYQVHGDLVGASLRWGQDVGHTGFAAVLEFGTWGSSVAAQFRSLRAVVLENQAYHHGAVSPHIAQRARAEFHALFAPQEQGWRRQAETQARQVFQRLLTWWLGHAAEERGNA